MRDGTGYMLFGALMCVISIITNLSFAANDSATSMGSLHTISIVGIPLGVVLIIVGIVKNMRA